MNSNFGCSILFSHYKCNNTIFYGECDFSCNVEESEFLTLINENEKTEHNKVVPIQLDKFHRLTFLGVKFYNEISFENRIFQKKTIFKEVVFYKAPKFHNCELHQDTDFHGSEFKDTYSQTAERAYRTLKLIMDKKRARREEGMFFSLEQKSMLNIPLRKYNLKIIDFIRFLINSYIIRSIARKNDDFKSNESSSFIIEEKELHAGFYVSLTEKIVSYLYLITSDYGQSIKRPLLILLSAMLIVFPVIYMIMYKDLSFINTKWSSVFHISFQQMFRPFEIYTIRANTQYANLPIGFYFIATIQSMLSVGLITLIILAIRGKFRMY
jgi:hypothetical protein